MKITKKFATELGVLVINGFVAFILIILLLKFDVSFSKSALKIKSFSNALTIDLAVIAPILSFLLFLLVGIVLDYFVNSVSIKVCTYDVNDIDIKLAAPSVNDIPSKILIDIEAKNEIKNEKLIKIEVPSWISFQAQTEQDIIIEDKNKFYINLSKLNYSEGKYTAKVTCFVISNYSGNNVHEFIFKKRGTNFKYWFFLNSQSIKFRQLREGENV